MEKATSQLWATMRRGRKGFGISQAGRIRGATPKREIVKPPAHFFLELPIMLGFSLDTVINETTEVCLSFRSRSRRTIAPGRRSNDRYRVDHLFAKCRKIRAIAVLSLAALAFIVLAGVPVIGHASAANAQTLAHQDHHHHRDAAGANHHGNAHPQVTPAAMANCCHEERGQTDCAALCATMVGCQLHLMPGDGLIDIVSGTAGAISEKPAFQTEFSTSPATPPPKARI